MDHQRHAAAGRDLLGQFRQLRAEPSHGRAHHADLDAAHQPVTSNDSLDAGFNVYVVPSDDLRSVEDSQCGRMEKRDHPGLTLRHDEPGESPKVVCADRARVHHRRHPTQDSRNVRFQVEVVIPDLPQCPGNVSVQVNESGDDQRAGCVDDVLDAAANLSNNTIVYGDIRNGVQSPTGVEHPPAGDQQVNCFWMAQGCTPR